MADLKDERRSPVPARREVRPARGPGKAPLPLLERLGQACPKFESCNAPLCPLSTELEECRWYPDEPICRLPAYQELGWVRAQLQLARRRGAGEDYFTVARLVEAGRGAAPRPPTEVCLFQSAAPSPPPGRQARLFD